MNVQKYNLQYVSQDIPEEVVSEMDGCVVTLCVTHECVLCVTHFVCVFACMLACVRVCVFVWLRYRHFSQHIVWANLNHAHCVCVTVVQCTTSITMRKSPC